MCDLDYGYMGFTRNIIKIKGKTIQYTDMSLESACENENNVLLLKDNSITLPQPLRSFPSGVCDELVGNKLIQRVGVQLLDGSENWYIIPSAPISDTNMLFSCDLTFRAKNKTNLYCNNFILSKAWSNTSLEGIAIGRSDLNGFDIRINKSRLSTQDVTGFKKWLSQNPTIVYYEVATYIEHTIDININKIKKSKCYNKIKPTII